LIQRTLTSVEEVANAGAIIGTVSPTIARLAEGALKVMLTSKIKLATAGVVIAALALAGFGVAPRGAPNTAAAADHPSSADVTAADLDLAPETGQPPPAVADDIQPNDLNFGSVRVGATAEGSVRIFHGKVNASGVALKVEPPAFVRINDIKIGSQDYGGNIRGFCDLALSLDTQRPGNFSGDIRLEIGDQRVAVPVAATVRPQMPGLTRLLVVQTPFAKFTTKDTTMFAAWSDLISEGHFDVHYLDAQHGTSVLGKIDLAKIDVVLLGQEGLFFHDSDVKRLKDFIERGGRVILAANFFYRGTVAKANELLTPYGLRMIDTESQERREFDLGAAEIVNDPLNDGVKTLHFFRPSPITVTDSQKGTILAHAADYPGQGFVAKARAGEGEVVALGQSLWWSWIAKDQAKGSDNAVLLANLLKKSPKRK
jgi:hypothetical protein